MGDPATFEVFSVPTCGKGQPNDAIQAGHRSARAMTHVTVKVETGTLRCLSIIDSLRDQIDSAPGDPYLLVNRTVHNSETVDENQLIPLLRS